MWLETLAREAWYSHNPGGIARFLSFVLRPIAALYAAGMQFRNSRYQKSKSLCTDFDVTIISVGNIALGGSGKTPTTIFIARLLRKEGIKAAVISRGYRGSMEGATATVSDGKTILLTAKEAGDEPIMMAGKLPGIPIIIGASRVEAVRFALDHFDVECIVLDDAFQHLAISRNLDVLCINGDLGLGNGRVFPSGPLRERLTGVSRAQLCLINHYGEYSQDIEWTLRNVGFEGLVVPVKYKLSTLLDASGERVETEYLKNKKGAAFASIAHPETFFNLLKSEGLNIQQNIAFSDHYQYKIEDFQRLSSLAKKKGFEYYVTTEKDGVKLPDHEREIKIPVLAAVVEPHTTTEDAKVILDIIKGAK